MADPANPSAMPDAESKAGEFVLRLSRVFHADRQTLFQAFTDPAILVRWWGPEGVTIPECHIDLRIGGRWRTCMEGANCEHNCVGGVYQEISPPARLAFTWAWDTPEGPGAETLITLEFHAHPDGCEMRFTQEGFADGEIRDRHDMGWGSSFNCLRDYLAEIAGK